MPTPTDHTDRLFNALNGLLVEAFRHPISLMHFDPDKVEEAHQALNAYKAARNAPSKTLFDMWEEGNTPPVTQAPEPTLITPPQIEAQRL